VSREREGVDGPWAGVVAGAVEGAREGPGAVMLLILDSGKVLVALVVQLLIVIVVTGCVLRNWVKMELGRAVSPTVVVRGNVVLLRGFVGLPMCCTVHTTTQACQAVENYSHLCISHLEIRVVK